MDASEVQELYDRLNRQLTMSMFPNREILYAEMDRQREQAAGVIRRLAAEINGLRASAESEDMHKLQAQIKELRQQLEEVEKERNEQCRKGNSLALAHAEILNQLLATQANVERLTKEFEELIEHAKVSDQHCKGAVDAYYVLHVAESALSTSPGLDAFHEALAKECERLKTYGLNNFLRFDEVAEWLDEEAAAHRAKKQMM